MRCFEQRTYGKAILENAEVVQLGKLLHTAAQLLIDPTDEAKPFGIKLLTEWEKWRNHNGDYIDPSVSIAAMDKALNELEKDKERAWAQTQAADRELVNAKSKALRVQKEASQTASAILDDAQSRADAILNEARLKAKEILNGADRKVPRLKGNVTRLEAEVASLVEVRNDLNQKIAHPRDANDMHARLTARGLKKLNQIETEIRRMEAVAQIIANNTAELACAGAE